MEHLFVLDPAPTAAGGPTTSVCVLIRVCLPDRPGALGLVASRIGALRGDIVRVVVLEHGGGAAVDELAVTLPEAGLIVMLEREIQEVDGTRVEHVEVMGRVPDAAVDARRFHPLGTRTTSSIRVEPHHARLSAARRIGPTLPLEGART